QPETSGPCSLGWVGFGLHRIRATGYGILLLPRNRGRVLTLHPPTPPFIPRRRPSFLPPCRCHRSSFCSSPHSLFLPVPLRSFRFPFCVSPTLDAATIMDTI
ncbi:hypothetical protein GW17_00050277, partial [Ensete ventricosum]